MIKVGDRFNRVYAPPMPFEDLRAVPSPARVAIDLAWDNAPRIATQVKRWTDEEAPSVIATLPIGVSSYSDTTIEANRIYRYQLQYQGVQSEAIIGVYSDTTKAFNYPALERVPDNLLGIDRRKQLTLPDNSTKTITVLAPKAKSRVITLADSSAPATNYDNLNTALASVTGGGKVKLPTGKFRLDPGADAYNLRIEGLKDVILEGAGLEWSSALNCLVPLTWIVFGRGDNPQLGLGSAQGAVLGSSQRVLLKNIIFDWDFPNALPGIVRTIDGKSQKFAVISGQYYVPDPLRPPNCYAVRGYHHAEKCFDQRLGSRTPVVGTFNPNFAVDGHYYYTIPGNPFPDGTEALAYVRSGVGLRVGTFARDISLEDVWLVGGGGPGLVHGAQGGGLRLSNCRFMRKPDALLDRGEQPRMVSFFGDSDSYSATADIIVEKSRFTDQDDDFMWLRGPMVQIQTLSENTGFTIARPTQSVNHTLTPGREAIQFLDPMTLAPIAAIEPQATWTQVFSSPNWIWTVSFPAIPELDAYIGLPEEQLPYVVMPDWASGNFAITDSQFGNSFGRILVRTRNGLIENNLFAHTHYAPIELDIVPTDGVRSSGPAPKNITVKGNILIGTGQGFTDFDWRGRQSSAALQSVRAAAGAIMLTALGGDGFVATGFPVKWVAIENNYICNVPGLAIAAYAAEDVTIRENTIVNANAVAFLANATTLYCGELSKPEQELGANQPWCLSKVAAKGSIMMAWSRRIDTGSNKFWGTSEGIFADPASTSEITQQGASL